MGLTTRATVGLAGVLVGAAAVAACGGDDMNVPQVTGSDAGVDGTVPDAGPDGAGPDAVAEAMAPDATIDASDASDAAVNEAATDAPYEATVPPFDAAACEASTSGTFTCESLDFTGANAVVFDPTTNILTFHLRTGALPIASASVEVTYTDAFGYSAGNVSAPMQIDDYKWTADLSSQIKTPVLAITLVILNVTDVCGGTSQTAKVDVIAPPLPDAGVPDASADAPLADGAPDAASDASVPTSDAGGADASAVDGSGDASGAVADAGAPWTGRCYP